MNKLILCRLHIIREMFTTWIGIGDESYVQHQRIIKYKRHFYSLFFAINKILINNKSVVYFIESFCKYLELMHAFTINPSPIGQCDNKNLIVYKKVIQSHLAQRLPLTKTFFRVQTFHTTSFASHNVLICSKIYVAKVV